MNRRSLMSRAGFRLLPLLALLGLGPGGCAEESPLKIVPQHPGSITAMAMHVQGREGELLSVGVWGPGVDWAPEADSELVVSRAELTIDSDDYSFIRVMTEVDADRIDTGVPMAFEPGDYSVVYFVGAAGQPPDRYCEVRTHVNGDRIAEAVEWESWSSFPARLALPPR